MTIDLIPFYNQSEALETVSSLEQWAKGLKENYWCSHYTNRQSDDYAFIVCAQKPSFPVHIKRLRHFGICQGY